MSIPDNKYVKPVLFGCSGTVLTSKERDFFAASQPAGFILFQRNCSEPGQVRQLTDDLRQSVGRADAPVFIDQEGGRVSRLKPPHWPMLPAMRDIGVICERDIKKGIEAGIIHARITAQWLSALGIIGNFAPVLDLYIEGASSAIGDRAISRD
ncbi:MAG: glycoside hydrolase family 3 N-terminal domain-containing protein, partial [Alphaproteobacteria bacterium]|nr:glycoside hydrolase family 3 N-terminal domain-containing protein [Alphaproteobacteria bacterium]